jgi:EpsI family protein
MKLFFSRHVLLGLAMIVTAGLTVAMTPHKKMAELGPKVKLEQMIPRQFGDWKVDESIVPIAPPPDVKAQLDKIYSQVLGRTYVNSQGERVMLSVAYGGDQSDAMRAHRPEVCYTTQGFQVVRQVLGDLKLPHSVLPVKRLVATRGRRNEPITYWITVGDRVARTATEQKLAEIRYGLLEQVADGILMRVSTVSGDEPSAFVLQTEFVNALYRSLDNRERAKFFGAYGQS